MTLSPDSVRRSLSRINARKAPGPDNIPGRVLRDCAVELTDVFTDIFNISLSQAVVPTCFKATTIIPVPKKSSPSCFNDYRPVALTPILMKCFERLVMQHIKSVLPPSLDPFQFAYRSNRSTDDAIATALHPALTHLDKTDTYVRLLFIDFSSAFNTIIPQQLIHKLVQLGLNTSLCNWLLDFLTGRPQAVRVGSNTSSTITLNTGAPQGCVLSPLLFTLLTHDCTPSHNSNLFIKFADDTTVVGLISNRDETNYRSEVSRLAGWCSDNNLSLNVEKTNEFVVDFRVVHPLHAPLTINGATVERVSSTKFLGVHITEDLSSLPSLQDIYSTRLTRKALCIAGDTTHPTHSFFSLLPSGRRLRSLQARTNRLKDSFIHQAVRKLNSLPSLPPLPSLTPRTTELWPPPPPPPPPPPHTTPTHSHTHTHTHTHTHIHTHCDQHQSLCTALDWPHSTTSSDSLNKDCSLFVTLNRIDLISSLHYTIHILHCLCISLVCTIYHVPYATLSIFIIILIFFYMSLFVYLCVLLLVFSVICMHQGVRE